MTKAEIGTKLFELIGDWRKVDKVFELMGKLEPEGYTNIRPEVHNYNKHLIKRVGRKKLTFTPEQLADPTSILRELEII